MKKSNLSDVFIKAKSDVAKQINSSSGKISESYSDHNKRSIAKSAGTINNDSYQARSDSLVLESATTFDSLPVLYDDVKSIFRNIFNKHGVTSETIGCHPDFIHLNNSEVLENGYTVTMFFDIAGSTKLGKTYDPDVVFNIKNTIIKYVIEIIQSFDGHVHRIMGDAVMAFFRSEAKAELCKKIDSAIDALNSGTYILEFMEQVITPLLGGMGAEDPIGVRIGIDYADDNDIIWGNYGVSGAFEVTATSYYVDVAAKLQQAARTNKIMIGDNLKKILGFGDDYLSIKTKYKTNEKGVLEAVPLRFVKPNYSVRGERINYRQYEFDNIKYFSFLPFGLKENLIDVQLHASKNGTVKVYYCPCAISLDKGMSLLFKVKYPYSYGKSLTLISEKKNTGPEAEARNATSIVVKSKVMDFYQGEYHGEISESTEYHGLHHMKIKIKDQDNKIIDETIFSIFIS